MPPQKGPGALGAVSAVSEANKQQVKMKKVEALCKQMLEEWVTLSEEKKEESLTTICTKLLEKMSPEFLEKLAEQLANGVSTLPAPAAADDGAKADEAEEFADAVEDPAPAIQSPKKERPAALADGGAENRFLEGMKKLLREVKDAKESEYAEAWSALVLSPEDEALALGGLLEAAMDPNLDFGAPELAAKVAAELARGQHVRDMKTFENALEALSTRLETIVQVHDTAWHVHSNVLLLMFPKTSSTQWGLLRAGWNWPAWWSTAQRVLDACDRYRAFDILVLILQMMQEKSGAVIKNQQVWKDGGRTVKIKKALSGWGEMDDDSIVSTLVAYGVEI